MFKQALRRAFNHLGLEIRRAPFPDQPRLNVLAVLGESDLLKQGDVYCMQIGANDGVTRDPIRELILRHRWQSVLVEPVPRTFTRLQENYKDCPWVQCVNCAVGRVDGQATLYTIEPRADDGAHRFDLLASFSREHVLKHGRGIPGFAARVKPVQVPALTLASLLKQASFERIDWLQVDTEGFDWEIIRMALTAKIFPKVISFESRHLKSADREEAAHRLQEAGYGFLSDDQDTLAVRVSELNGRYRQSY